MWGGDDNFEFNMFYEKSLPWYALSLGEFYLITILLKDINKKYVFLFSVLTACIAGYNSDITYFLSISRTIVFYPFFYAGYCINPDKLYTILNKMKYKLFAIVPFVILFVFAYNFSKDFLNILKFFNARFPYSEIEGFDVFGGVFRLLYYPAVFVLIFSFVALCPKKENIISIWGRRTLNVYALHYILRAVVTKLYYLGYPMDNLLGMGCCFSIFIISLSITIFFSLKIFVKPMNFILKPKWTDGEKVIKSD